jgi:hypothetical protein
MSFAVPCPSDAFIWPRARSGHGEDAAADDDMQKMKAEITENYPNPVKSSI